jgi:hypothetical protein
MVNVSTKEPAGRSSYRVRDRQQRRLVISTAAVLLVVVASAVLAGLHLFSTYTDSDWLPVSEEVLKISFQALAIGALGGLAKLIIDWRKAREVAQTELRDRRYRYISSLVELARIVDEAPLLVRADQSVKSWTDVINDRIIPAHCRLRDIIHELRNWDGAGLRVFKDTRSINKHLDKMDCYLKELVIEYADKKQELFKVQLQAEQARGKRREERQRLLWSQMQRLKNLGDLIDDGRGYGAFRGNYSDALLEMRQSLPAKGP